MMQKKTIIQSVMYVLQNAKKTGINLVPHPLKSFQCSINHWQPGPRPQFQHIQNTSATIDLFKYSLLK